MAEQAAQVTKIEEHQEGDRVLLSVPMVGFPPGFKLRPGERVVLVHGDEGPAVRPLVREMRVDSLAEETAGAFRAGEQRFALQAGTVRDDRGHPGPYVLSIVDRGSAEGPEQVIAVRPLEQGGQ